MSFVDLPDATYTLGMLGVYELNRVELIKDAFLWAYERSAHRYSAIRQTLGDPDPFRVRYRDSLKALVSEVVSQTLDKKRATAFVATWADRIPKPDRARFMKSSRRN